ncbi:biogenesis of lysosome-related organelles complex 1 subunit 1 [Folsomia candida]|uniref:biogenesis of lysosome-related organelles complex 1 subunit 1 n=1 Tax=Folsomia candida TaxID=158441 RepID=UPI000B8EF925|nr:biogenesis of lysosome-related organelles complex 1 subunit 1 [Folsomia candida]
MLSSLVKKHSEEQQKLREIQEMKRKEAIQAATELTKNLVDHLNVGVAQAYLNEKKLDSEMRTLTQNAQQFSRQTGQWLSLVDNFNTALKELGHVQSWAKAIESDVKTITTSLEYVYATKQESPEGGAAGMSSSTSSGGPAAGQ